MRFYRVERLGISGAASDGAGCLLRPMLPLLRLGLRRVALGLRHGDPALAFAAVHALAAVLRRLALGGALAGIDAGTMHRRGIGGHGNAGESGREEHCGGGGHCRIR